jgi:WD40 repeat protein
MWDAETGKALGAPLQGHTDRLWSVAISPDGTRIVSGSNDNTIRMWDAETGKAFGVPLQGRTDRVWSVAISHDGTRIVSGSADRTIRVWHLESFTHSQAIVCFSSNPTHALCSTISILPESHMSSLEASDLIPTRERWIAGPKGQHFLWIPSYFPSITYAPGNTLVIPDALQLDFSHFSRGTSWQMCRKY